MGLLRFLFIAIALMWVFRLVFRLIVPMLFQNIVHKAQGNGAQNQQQYRQTYKQNNPDSSLRVDYVPPKDKEAKAADKAGDFIDYEEIK